MSSLQIAGLSELQLLQLEEELSADVARISEEQTKDRHGDLGLTVAVVVVTAAAVHGLSVFLAKRRVESLRSSTLSLEKLPDGTVRLNISELSRGTSSEPPDASVVEALKAQLNAALQAK